MDQHLQDFDSKLPDQAILSQLPEKQYLNVPQPGKGTMKSQFSQASSRLKYIGDYKMMKSYDFFKNTRVQSCSYIQNLGNTFKAVPYYKPPQLTFADKMKKSEFQKSYSHATFKVRPLMHAGMKDKPLELYTPNSYRNRLPILDLKPPVTNGSQIVFGNRSEQNKRQFVSQSKNTYGNFGKFDPVSNTGILAEKTKWHHKQQQK